MATCLRTAIPVMAGKLQKQRRVSRHRQLPKGLAPRMALRRLLPWRSCWPTSTTLTLRRSSFENCSPQMRHVCCKTRWIASKTRPPMSLCLRMAILAMMVAKLQPQRLCVAPAGAVVESPKQEFSMGSKPETECEPSAQVATTAVAEEGAEIASMEEFLAQIDSTNLEQEQLRELQSPDEARARQDTVDSEEDEASDVHVPSNGRSSDAGREAAAGEECEPSAQVATTAVAEEFLAQIDSTNLEQEQLRELQSPDEARARQDTVDSEEDEASDIRAPSPGRSSDDEECEPSPPAATAALAEEQLREPPSPDEALVPQETVDSEEDEASDVPLRSDGHSSDDGREAAAAEECEPSALADTAAVAEEGAKIASMKEMLAEIDNTSLEQEQLRELPPPDEAHVPQKAADSEEDQASDVSVPSDGRSSDDGHEAAATEECEPSAPAATAALAEEGTKIASMKEMLAEIDNTSLEQEQLRELPPPDEARVPQKTADSEEDQASDVSVPADGRSSDDGHEAAATEECEPSALAATAAVAEAGAKIASMKEMLAEIDNTSLEQEQLRELPPPDEARVPQKTADSEEDQAFDVPVPSDGRSSDDGHEAAAAEECEPSALAATAALAEEGAKIASMEEMLAEIDNTSFEQEQLRELPPPDEARVPQKAADSEEDQASDVPVPSDALSSDDGQEAAATEECEPSAPAATAALAEEGAKIASMEEMLAEIDNTSFEQEQLRELPPPDEARVPQKTADSEEDQASDVSVPSDGRSSDDGHEAAATEECEPSAPAATAAVAEEGAKIASMEEMLAEIDNDTSFEQEQLRELPPPDEARVPQKTVDSEEDQASSDVPVPSDGCSGDDGREAAAAEECEPSAPAATATVAEEGAEIASMEELLAQIDNTNLDSEQLRELPSPDEARVPQETVDSEQDEASDVPVPSDGREAAAAEECEPSAPAATAAVAEEGAEIASMEELLAQIDNTNLESEQLRELPSPDEARVPQETVDSEQDEASDVPVPSDGREAAAAEECEPSAPAATAAVAEEGAEIASMEELLAQIDNTNLESEQLRELPSPDEARVPQETVDSEQDEASDVPVPSDGREAAAAEECEPSAPAATAAVAEEGGEIASMEELLAQIDNTNLESEQLRELPSPDEEHGPCQPAAVAEEQSSQLPSPEKLAEEQVLQLPADRPAPAEVSDDVLSDTSPSDLILRSVLKEAETLEKSRPRNEDEEEVDSDGGHPPLSPARNLGMALAAAVDESPRLEVQDDVPPVSGADAVDSERARNLEEDAESEPPNASFLEQQPSASEALTTGVSSLTGSIEGADGSRTVQQAVVAAMFEAIDTNHDGMLSKEEFQNFLTRPAEEPLHAEPEVKQVNSDKLEGEKHNEDVPSMQALLAQIDNDYLEEHELSLSPQPAAAAKEQEIAAAAQPATALEDDKEVPPVQPLVSTPREEQEPKVSAEPAAVQEAGVDEGKSTGAVEPEDRDFDAESSTRASDSAMLEAFLNAPPEELHGCWRGDSISPSSRAQSARLWRQIRAQPLPPRDPEENYEMSSQGEFMDMEEEERELHLEHLRAAKRSPRWCENYKEVVRSQADWNPDDVFGVRAPEVNLDQILPDKLYLAQKLHRSYKKRRGSSGKWEKDRCKEDDVTQYRSKMGHSKAWLLDVEALSAAARARQEGAMFPESGSSNEYLAAGGMQDNVVHHEPESGDEEPEGLQDAEQNPSEHAPEPASEPTEGGVQQSESRPSNPELPVWEGGTTDLERCRSNPAPTGSECLTAAAVAADIPPGPSASSGSTWGPFRNRRSPRSATSEEFYSPERSTTSSCTVE
ncbi:unnamed protein product [Symbiodinium sp. CCMP2592]|nr:unnamed protein product [Symbiodinium sp. CCMP2592]